MHRRSDVAIAQREAVVAMIGIGLVGKAGGMKRAVKPIAAAVASEHPAGAIAAMRRRRQADDQKLRVGIAKAGQGAAQNSLTIITPRRMSRAASRQRTSRAHYDIHNLCVERCDFQIHSIVLT